MNDWHRYQMQQASYNLIAIITRPKVILLFLVLGFLMQLYFSHNDSTKIERRKPQDRALAIVQQATR